MTQEAVREALTFLPDQQAAAGYPEPQRGIVEMLANMRLRPESAGDLANAAKLRPELFVGEILDHVIRAAHVHAVSDSMCRVLESVVLAQRAVPAQLDAQLLSVLEHGRVDSTTSLGTICAENGSPHTDDVIRKLMDYVYGRDSFAAMSGRPEWVEPLLMRLAKLNSDLIADLLVVRLKDHDASARQGAAKLAGELGFGYPATAPRLRVALLDALSLDHELFESAGAVVTHALGLLYAEDPSGSDADIQTFRRRASPGARKRALHVYERALHLATPRPDMGSYLKQIAEDVKPSPEYAPDGLSDHILGVVLDVMEAEQQLDSWEPAADVLEEAGRGVSTGVLRGKLDRVLFSLVEAGRLSNTQPPRLALAGVPQPPAALLALQKSGDDVRWQGVSTAIASAIGGAARGGDPEVVDGIIKTIDRLAPVDDGGWVRAELVKVLSVLTPSVEGRARLVPLIFKYAMSLDVPISVAALGLCEDLIKRHQDELPDSLLDMISALVISSYVYVGRAAVGAAAEIRPRTNAFRDELISRLIGRSQAEGTDWRPRAKALAAAVRVAQGGEQDLAARVLASCGPAFFQDAPSLYGRSELREFRRWDAPMLYQAAYLACVLPHLERPLRSGDEPAVGDFGDIVSDFRRCDPSILARVAGRLVGVAERLVPQHPDMSFDLATVLSDAGRPDLALRVVEALVAKKGSVYAAEYYARLAVPAAKYYAAEVHLANGGMATARSLFAEAADGFEAIHER